MSIEGYFILYFSTLLSLSFVLSCAHRSLNNCGQRLYEESETLQTETPHRLELQEIIIDYSPFLAEIDNKEEDCTICLQTKKEGDIRMIKCTHSYHYKCINKWLNIKQTCPNCRTCIK